MATYGVELLWITRYICSAYGVLSFGTCALSFVLTVEYIYMHADHLPAKEDWTCGDNESENDERKKSRRAYVSVDRHRHHDFTS